MVGSFPTVRVGPLSSGSVVDVGGVVFSPAALFLWEDRATVHLVAASEAPVDHAAAIDGWARSGRVGDLPGHPCTDAFSQLTITLILADGTEAVPVGTSCGGSDTEWEATAQFRLAPGGAAGQLVVRMGKLGASPIDVPFPSLPS